MRCPRCREALVVVEREGIEVDWCTACRGIWFDEGELELLAERSDRTLGPGDLGPHAEWRRTSRRCPRCRRRMERANLGRVDPVCVDRCRHGLWLDAGELGALLSALPPGETSDQALIVQFLGETFARPVASAADALHRSS